MDADGKTDIVTLDDSGEINILYGTTRYLNGKTEHIFTKKLIESGLGMRLSKEARNDGGAFSYTSLKLPDQKALSTDTEGLSGSVNQTMIDNIIYYQFGYQSENESVSTDDKRNAAITASL